MKYSEGDSLDFVKEVKSGATGAVQVLMLSPIYWMLPLAARKGLYNTIRKEITDAKSRRESYTRRIYQEMVG